MYLLAFPKFNLWTPPSYPRKKPASSSVYEVLFVVLKNPELFSVSLLPTVIWFPRIVFAANLSADKVPSTITLPSKNSVTKEEKSPAFP